MTDIDLSPEGLKRLREIAAIDSDYPWESRAVLALLGRIDEQAKRIEELERDSVTLDVQREEWERLRRIEDRSEVVNLDRIYAAEQNGELNWFWDSGAYWALGDATNGYTHKGYADTPGEAIEQMVRALDNEPEHRDD